MAKNLNVLGFMDSVAKTSESQNISKNKEDSIKEEKVITGDNKNSKNDISINISTKGVTITNLKRKKTKVNKTFYLENDSQITDLLLRNIIINSINMHTIYQWNHI